MTTTILQIIPCPVELYAKFKQGKDEDFTTRIIALALVEDVDRYRSIIGVEWCEDELGLVTSSANFAGYTDRPIK